MADSDDQIEASAKKYGWSPSEVAYYKSLRGDIPQALPSQAPSGAGASQNASQSSAGALNPQNIDPSKAAQAQSGFQNAMGMARGGVVQDHTVIADHGKPALGYDHSPAYHKGTSNPTISNVPNYDDGGTVQAQASSPQTPVQTAQDSMRKAFHFAHGGRVPVDSPPQLPGLEEQQQMDMKTKSLKKLRGY
jgi:hypothetical protein